MFVELRGTFKLKFMFETPALHEGRLKLDLNG